MKRFPIRIPTLLTLACLTLGPTATQADAPAFEPPFSQDLSHANGSSAPPWLNKVPASLPQQGKIGFQGKHGGAPITCAMSRY